MLMCVYESERKWKDSIVVEWGQRVNFPLIYDDSMCSQVLFLKGKSPVLIDDFCFPVLYKFIPSVWNDFISMRWCYDAVSYTHLDVYKRQDQNSSQGCQLSVLKLSYSAYQLFYLHNSLSL